MVSFKIPNILVLRLPTNKRIATCSSCRLVWRRRERSEANKPRAHARKRNWVWAANQQRQQSNQLTKTTALHRRKRKSHCFTEITRRNPYLETFYISTATSTFCKKATATHIYISASLIGQSANTQNSLLQDNIQIDTFSNVRSNQHFRTPSCASAHAPRGEHARTRSLRTDAIFSLSTFNATAKLTKYSTTQQRIL